MKLKYVAVTGADDGVGIDDLNQLYERFPFVEWALLYMPERSSEPRFPSAAWLKEFHARYKGAHKAMHLCGSAFLGFANGDPAITEVIKHVNRIQLNLEFGDVDGRYEPQKLLQQIKAHPEHEFIIQYTARHHDLLPALQDIPNHAILFDQSAGRGVLPDSWPKPIDGHFCGYAGGITPKNIDETLKNIAQISGDTATWIDMESGVRTDDQLDLSKVEQILLAAQKWIA